MFNYNDQESLLSMRLGCLIGSASLPLKVKDFTAHLDDLCRLWANHVRS